MRGDRRIFERQPVGGEDAPDAGARTLHRALQGRDREGRDRGPLTCARARRMLAAYRRDDWPTADLIAFSRHLASCADCRRAEVDYRRTGEMIRHLPSITPPPAFREAVFAAIRAEERQLAPEVARLSRAATNPEMPVIRLAPRAARPTRVRLAPRVALVAAVLLLSFVTAKLLPALDPSTLDRTATRVDADPASAVARYAVDARYSAVTGAMATSAWLVYSAADASHGAM